MKSFAFILSILPLLSWAAIDDYNVSTWNLQGSSSLTENKWNNNVRQLISGARSSDILMLQEAGSVPSSAVLTPREFYTPGIPMNEYEWNLGTNSRPQTMFIYFSRVDVGANRVNLAIVSSQRADEVIVLPPPTVASRPIIGIRLGNDVFFSTHALANRGVDAPAIVNSVLQYFDRQTDPIRQAANWMIAGDFNRSPVDLQNSLDIPAQRHTQIVAPVDPTQASGGTLDYAVIGNSVSFIPSLLRASLLFGNMRGQFASDHFPVGFFRR
ncbi:cytolethal distending toxin subunit B family protein [Aliivibrio sp. S4TY2]|uniref:cytolethal distending toxin subunit B family protein n=1 Tax=unclassified Aliivibrio TaxID=2645654 RepID=UPI0023782849|nr:MULTISPECIES: cytolethal distending toxin subunit B family protein [unclassified Aliivibrio]MDD9158426.1 cytolethal distending toxin subunit B family protein [Aliivibrio sp. S4TY2]MDD9162426.1 cytolethal distending toxin subunit B family protein [Aliivibrio sp. S4TY1]MDD9166433.1 cytolethal distending toxin subunit B family protein [Aliivibrio sp. S4MY2]MDD9170437.1 cytolethal distending toxin subunit B family protein [Aliivibrio sp. S4MY4]MDD9187512.1 cytolethal distending toxin subunit B 